MLAGRHLADIQLVRFTVGGTLDASFGTGGLVRTDFTSSSTDYAFGLVEQPDGKLVIAGGANGGV